MVLSVTGLVSSSPQASSIFLVDGTGWVEPPEQVAEKLRISNPRALPPEAEPSRHDGGEHEPAHRDIGHAVNDLVDSRVRGAAAGPVVEALEDRVVHLPELVLVAGAGRRLRRLAAATVRTAGRGRASRRPQRTGTLGAPGLPRISLQSRASRLALSGLALLLLVGWFLWYATTPEDLPTNDRAVSASGVAGTPLYVGMFSASDDFDRTLRISGVKVHATTSADLDVQPERRAIPVGEQGDLAQPFLVGPPVPQGDRLHIDEFAVAQTLQGKGLGRGMLKTVIDWARAADPTHDRTASRAKPPMLVSFAPAATGMPVAKSSCRFDKQESPWN